MIGHLRAHVYLRQPGYLPCWLHPDPFPAGHQSESRKGPICFHVVAVLIGLRAVLRRGMIPPPAFPHSSTQIQWHPGGLKHHVPLALPFRATFLQISFYWHFLQFNQPWIAFESVERKRGKEKEGAPPPLLETQSQLALFGKMLQ